VDAAPPLERSRATARISVTTIGRGAPPGETLRIRGSLMVRSVPIILAVLAVASACVQSGDDPPSLFASAGTRARPNADSDSGVGSDDAWQLHDRCQALDASGAGHDKQLPSATVGTVEFRAVAPTPQISREVPQCMMSVCAPEYPCQPLGDTYTCRGQFPDYPPNCSSGAFTVAHDGTVCSTQTCRWRLARANTRGTDVTHRPDDAFSAADRSDVLRREFWSHLL